MDEGSEKGWCKITELEKMTGEVTVQSRKQKKFPLYELEITLKWEGQLWDESGKVIAEAKGKVKIPDLSEETYDDLEMTVTLDDEKAAMRPLKEAMRTTGGKRIREKCLSFVKTLKESVASDAPIAAKKPPVDQRVNNTYVVSGKESTKTKEIKIKYSFAPHPTVLYDTLLDTERMRGATASDCSMSKDVGGKFTMFSGSVEGENLALVPFTEESGLATIKWKWRFNTWQPGKHSTVTIVLNVKDDKSTELVLTQTGVPEDETERTEKGFKNLLLDRLKAMLGGTILG